MSRWVTSPPADAAIEIAAESVSIAVVSGRGGAVVVDGFAVEPLPSGAVVPSLTGVNIADRAAVVASLRSAVERLGVQPRRVALVVPDVIARVSLVRFEQIPARRDDLEQLVRWQVRKSAPFPIDEAMLSYVPGGGAGGEREFVVVLARRDVIREYEQVCEAVQMHPGLVDLSTLGLVNALLATPEAPAGDWLVAHMRPGYTSLVIMRGSDVIFFRSVPESDSGTIGDLVHQTAMYHQDRLGGARFGAVLVGGYGGARGALDAARGSVETRLGTTVQTIDPARAAAFTDRITASPELAAALAPAIGTLLRMRAEAARVA